LIAVGKTGTGRPLFVAFTMRTKEGRRLIRPVTPAICTRGRSLLMKRKVPRLKTDEQAEAFLAQDLSKLDFSQLKPARFEFENKDEQINMRVPKPLLAAVKARAKARGIPYTRFIRETLEQAVTASK
jgi:predicted DNA binding CopG/RHH family protein